jgi:hypothetical protein
MADKTYSVFERHETELESEYFRREYVRYPALETLEV